MISVSGPMSSAKAFEDNSILERGVITHVSRPLASVSGNAARITTGAPCLLSQFVCCVEALSVARARARARAR